MDKIWFETANTRLEVDKNKRFQMSKNSEFVSMKLDSIQLDKLIEFLQNIKKL
jgi:hypothetical protein